MEKKHPIETMTAAFFYDRAGNLLSSTVVEVEKQFNGITFTSNGFSEPEAARKMLKSFLEINGIDQVVGWLTSSSGRCRCFVVPPTRAAAGDLLKYLESIEEIYFKRRTETPAFEIKPSATKS